MKISRKEAKESKYWIRLLQELNPEYSENSISLFEEADELRKIFSAIISKSSS
ncbi:MAG: four helix bundle protein [Flavobacterium sp.]|nr:four helix bundle protein [Flavobacterium sp.]MCZ8168611.1 four helix bundle protein [Flavobacterium sp.]